MIETTVQDSSAEALREQGLRPALQPKVEILPFNEGADLEYKLAVELLPEIKPIDFAELRLERLRPQVAEEEVEQALLRIAAPHRKSEPVDRPAETGDLLTIDFAGTVEGKEFAGAKATDYRLELGSARFVPGFEDQLVGVTAGEQRTVAVTLPTEFGNEEIAGKPAEFAVTIKTVAALQPPALDDELAEQFGLETIAALRQRVREQIERDYAGLARQRLKRSLLDELAARHDFPLPPGMVDMEFDTIWKQFTEAREQNKEAALEAAGKSEDELKAEYRALAERRVRLGLLLAEIGRTSSITVTQDELTRALSEEARRNPGYETQIVEFYRSNPQAFASLRAPIFEDKVIDLVIEMAKVTDRPVSVAELIAAESGAAGTAAGEAAAPSGG